MSNLELAKREFEKRIAGILNDVKFILTENKPEDVVDGIRRAVASKYRIPVNEFLIEAKTKEQIQRELAEATKKVEEYLTVDKLIQSQVQEFQDKLEKRMGIEKKREEMDKITPEIKKMISELGEHRMIVSSVLYKLKEAFPRTDVADSETVNRVLELIRGLVREDKMKRFRQLSRKLFEKHEVKEKFDVQLLEPEEMEGQKMKIEKEREKAHASLKTQAGVWESIKGFFSEFMSFLQSDKEEWSMVLQELDQVVSA
jgi:DNA repair exonuclease SbcCD nuclease subunit